MLKAAVVKIHGLHRLDEDELPDHNAKFGRQLNQPASCNVSVLLLYSGANDLFHDDGVSLARFGGGGPDLKDSWLDVVSGS